MSVKEFFKEIFKGFLKGFYILFDLKSFSVLFILGCMYKFLNALYFKGGLPLDFSFLPLFPSHLTGYPGISSEELKQLQEAVVNISLRSMQWNEICFYINPNSIEFQQAKILYQLKLKIFLENLNLDEFHDPNEALIFITEFYDHYLKLIELNNEVIKNININPQYYNHYNTFCIFLYRILFFIIYIKFIYYLFVSFEKR